MHRAVAGSLAVCEGEWEPTRMSGGEALRP